MRLSETQINYLQTLYEKNNGNIYAVMRQNSRDLEQGLVETLFSDGTIRKYCRPKLVEKETE
jgi:hypothetical protein